MTKVYIIRCIIYNFVIKVLYFEYFYRTKISYGFGECKLQNVSKIKVALFFLEI